MDRDIPLVTLRALPDHDHKTPAPAKGPPDVDEGRDWITKEHRAEPADYEIETKWVKAMHLRVGNLEFDVAWPLRCCEVSGAIDRRRGYVDPQRAAFCGETRGFAGCLPGPTPDIKDVVAEPNTPGPAEHFVVQLQLGIEVD